MSGSAPVDGQPIRVLTVIKCLSIGGAERLLISVSKTRNRHDFYHETAYVLATHGGLVGELEATGVAVHGLGANSHFDLRWIPRLRKLICAGHFDVVHFHLPYADMLGRLTVRSIPKRSRPAYVTTQHGIWPSIPAGLRLLDWLTFPLVDWQIAVSDVVRDSMPPRFRSRVEVLLHGLAVDDLVPLSDSREDIRAELGVAHDEIVVLAVGNLRKEKGYEVLLETAKLLLDDGVPVKMFVAGYGELQEPLQASQARLGLEHVVTFLGLRSDPMRLLAASDIYVLPSLHEGFPVAVMEALAVGVPVVATAVGEIPHVIMNDVQGLTVPPGNPTALATALKELASDPARRERMAVAAKLRGRDFDIRGAVGRMEEGYRQLASHRSVVIRST